VAPKKQPRRGPGQAHRDAAEGHARFSTLGVALPVTISDQTCKAAAGLEPKTWKRRLVEWRVPHGRVGRRTVCLAEDWTAAVARAIGRETPAPGVAVETRDAARQRLRATIGGRR
jgi:hypothetical protein